MAEASPSSMAATRLGRPRPERPAAILVRHWAILWPGLLQKKHITAPVPLKLLLPGPRGFIRNLYCGRPFLFRIAFTSRSWAASSSSTSPTSSGSFSASEAAMLVTLYPLSLRRSLMMLSISLASFADSSGSVGPSYRTLVRISSRRPPRKTVLSISHCIRFTP